MTHKVGWILVGFTLLGSGQALFGSDASREKGPKELFEVTTTEHVPFLSGGAIRLEKSYGFLAVEGWDQPEVEITVTKSTDRLFESGERERAAEYFDQIGVSTNRRSEKELVISTALPARNRLVLPSHNKHGITLTYTVRVPRDSRLEIHHDDGYVLVSDVTGDIEVDSHTGDMIITLPAPGTFSIDATSKFGSIASDFTGKAPTRFLLGNHFTSSGQSSSRRIHLRMGRGCITIKKGPPSNEPRP